LCLDALHERLYPFREALGTAFLCVHGADEFERLPDDFYVDLDGTSLSCGFHHTCALELRGDLDFGGALRCWGFNDHDQASPPQGHFIQVSSGHLYSCGIRGDETVACWGLQGQPPPGLFLQISAGEFHVCGVTKESEVQCWGGHVFAAITPPPGKYVQVSAGKDFSCGLRPNGIAVCWGDGRRGSTSPPTDVQFKQLSVSSYSHYACGVTALEGAVRCWGDGKRHGYSVDKPGPYLQVSTGNRVTCGIRALDGHIECWGVEVQLPHTEAFPHEWEQVTLGFQHVCGIHLEGGVVCWGHKFRGVEDQEGGHAVSVPDGFMVA